MKIVITGGTGLIGSALVKVLSDQQNELILLVRDANINTNDPRIKFVQWNVSSNDWFNSIDGADAVINLAGASIGDKRWSEKRKKEIIESRTLTTNAIVKAISKSKSKPEVLINASAVGFYGNVAEGDVTEDSPKGEGFLADVCAQWEAEALKAQEFGVRVVLLRTGIVLDKNGGALKKMLLPFRLFVGGPLGSGNQWFPWIHLEDEVNAILFLLENKNINGAVNLSAPQPVRMKEFAKALGKVLHRPSLFTVPAFVLKAILGEMAEPLVLNGQKAIPKKLLDAGFKFNYPELKNTLENILFNAEGV